MYKCFDCSTHRLQDISLGASNAALWLVAWPILGFWLVAGLTGVWSVVAGYLTHMRALWYGDTVHTLHSYTCSVSGDSASPQTSPSVTTVTMSQWQLTTCLNPPSHPRRRGNIVYCRLSCKPQGNTRMMGQTGWCKLIWSWSLILLIILLLLKIFCANNL